MNALEKLALESLSPLNLRQSLHLGCSESSCSTHSLLTFLRCHLSTMFDEESFVELEPRRSCPPKDALSCLLTEARSSSTYSSLWIIRFRTRPALHERDEGNDDEDDWQGSKGNPESVEREREGNGSKSRAW